MEKKNLENILSKNFPKIPPPSRSQPFPPMDPQMLLNLFMQQSNRPVIPATPHPSTTTNSVNPLLQCNMFFPFLPQPPTPHQFQQSSPLSGATRNTRPSIPCTPTSLASSTQSTSPYSIENILSAAAAPQKFITQIPQPRSQLQQSQPPLQYPQMPDPAYLLNLFTPPTASSTNNYRPQPPPILRVHVTRESSRPLREWMIAHLHDPYPTPNEIEELANITNFSRKQVRDWFTNNRRRYEQRIKNKQPLPWKKREAPKTVRDPF